MANIKLKLTLLHFKYTDVKVQNAPYGFPTGTDLYSVLGGLTVSERIIRYPSDSSLTLKSVQEYWKSWCSRRTELKRRIDSQNHSIAVKYMGYLHHGPEGDRVDPELEKIRQEIYIKGVMGSYSGDRLAVEKFQKYKLNHGYHKPLNDFEEGMVIVYQVV